MEQKKKQVLKIAFLDFWEGANISEIISFLHLDEYDLIEDYDNPDLVIYSCFGERHLDYLHCKLLFFCAENVVPDFNTCDYAISTLRIQYADRNLWIPYAHFASLTQTPTILESGAEITNRKFCSFIYSQDHIGKGAKLRKEFCQQLMNNYKTVDCPGKILNNMHSSLLAKRDNASDWHNSKIRFLNGYKFNIAFENSDAPGYITEKLIDCYIANTVPIYWGSNGDIAPYPKESIICANDYESVEALIERIKEVDSNDALYLSILRANPFSVDKINKIPNFAAQIHDFIEKIINAEQETKGHVLWADSTRYAHYKQEHKKKHIRFAIKIANLAGRVIKKLSFLSKNIN